MVKFLKLLVKLYIKRKFKKMGKVAQKMVLKFMK